jgi:hypothetical protein
MWVPDGENGWEDRKGRNKAFPLAQKKRLDLKM